MRIALKNNIAIEIARKLKEPNEVLARILKKIKKDLDINLAKDTLTAYSQDEQALAQMLLAEKIDPLDSPDEFANTILLLSQSLKFMAESAPTPLSNDSHTLMQKDSLIPKSEQLRFNSAWQALINYKETIKAMGKPNIMPTQAKAMREVFGKDAQTALEYLLGKPKSLSYKQIESLNKIAPTNLSNTSDPAYVLSLQQNISNDEGAQIQEGEKSKMISGMSAKDKEQTQTQRVESRK